MLGSSEEGSPRELSLHEINAGIPGKVRPTDGMQKALWLGLFVLGVLATLMAGYVHSKIQEALHREALSRVGRDAPARVTKIRPSRHGSWVYYAFRFGGAVYQGKVNSDDMVWDAHVGELIPIRFLPSDPSVNHPTPWVLWVWSDFVFVAFMLFSFGVAANAAVWVYGERRLARIGWVTEGKVIACAPNGSRFRVDYEIFDEHNTLFDGANENSDEYKTDSSIRVIYLRKNPKRNDTYPMDSFHTVE
jgi:hypothetical protein